MEKRNFREAGLSLARLWSTLVIDKGRVLAEYKNPPKSSHSPGKYYAPIDEEYMAIHAR